MLRKEPADVSEVGWICIMALKHLVHIFVNTFSTVPPGFLKAIVT